MTKLLGEALSEASKLPKDEQDALARSILVELEIDHQWDKTFEDSADVLERLANEALQEHRTGPTKLLDPEIASHYFAPYPLISLYDPTPEK